jgi:hypothetical protein
MHGLKFVQSISQALLLKYAVIVGRLELRNKKYELALFGGYFYLWAFIQPSLTVKGLSKIEKTK